MGRFMTSDRWLGLFFLALALVIIFIWAPLDTGSGIAEKVRRRWSIGDALGPTVAGVVLLIGAVLAGWKPGKDAPRLSQKNVIWVVGLIALFAVSIAVMRWAGPLAASVTEEGYRPLRATIPWKYLGYLIGGTLMVGGLTSLVRGQFRASDWVVALLATLFIALIYDLPFDDLLLPPNGDV